MARIFLSLGFAIWMCGFAHAQFYLKPGIRYHSPITRQEAPDYFNAAIVVVTGGGFYYTYIINENNEFTLAEGLSYGINTGYIVNEHIGIDAGFFYFANNKEFQSEDIWPHYPLGSTSWQFRTFNITPSLVLTHSNGRLTLRGKAGFLGGLSSLGKSIFFETKRKTFKFNPSLSAGYVLSLEAGFNLTESVTLAVEVGIENQFYKPRKAFLKYDDFTYSEFDELPVYLKEIYYVRKIDNETVYFDNQTDTYYTDYNKPLLRLKETLKLNSFYTGLGLKYYFRKK